MTAMAALEGIVGMVLISCAWCALSGCADPMPSASDCATLSSALPTAIPNGTCATVALPAGSRVRTVDGRAIACRDPGGTPYVVGKQHVGWKDNFEGFACFPSSAPAPTSLESLSVAGAPGVSWPPSVRRARSPGVLEVYFDLN